METAITGYIGVTQGLYWDNGKNMETAIIRKKGVILFISD